MLGYNLPVNWGNAADWLVDAERSGLSVGPLPRVGSIAVFPRADGVWAYGSAGHVAFVTNVYPDRQTFDVTYQNYGDPTPMYIGRNYNVSLINQAGFQDGTMNFIYFPQPLDMQRFVRLPGIGSVNFQGLLHANSLLNETNAVGSTYTSDRLTLGLAPDSSDQEFHANFTGSDPGDLLLYNRHAGQLTLLRLHHPHVPGLTLRYTQHEPFEEDTPISEDASPQLIQLGDTITPVGKWGPDLEVHIGRFAGTSASDILLYNRVSGTIQLISLRDDFSIKRHVTLPGYGPGWELYVGQFDQQRSGLFLYNRFAAPISEAMVEGTNPSLPPMGSQVSPPIVVPSSVASPTASTPPSHPLTVRKPAKTRKLKPAPKPDVKPRPPRPQLAPTPSPLVTSTPVLVPGPSPTLTAAPTPTLLPSPTNVLPIPTQTPTSPSSPPVATPTPGATAAPQSTSTSTVAKQAFRSAQFMLGDEVRLALPQPVSRNALTELSGTPLTTWEKQDRFANIYVLDFNSNFSIRHKQQYTLWHANWEVYVGRFAGMNQDGIFLFDRVMGEGRLMDFNQQMLVQHYQKLHHLSGNWVVYSGDFTGIGRAQLLLYDPGSGEAKMLMLAHDLRVEKQKTYVHWIPDSVLYVGHFGMPALSIMLYEPQLGESTFIGFNSALNDNQQYTIRSWDQSWQILIGSFLHQSCLENPRCASSDDILVLNRQTDQIQQYTFSFGRKFKLYDNRLQAFERLGLTINHPLTSVNTSTFNFVSVLRADLRNEELY